MEKNGTKILKVLNISSISLDKARFILFSFDKKFRLDSINVRDKHLQHAKNVFNYLNFCKIYSFHGKQSICMFYEQAYYD